MIRIPRTSLVLNALRHQRFVIRRFKYLGRLMHGQRCSTPYGITGIVTKPLILNSCARSGCAQRLTASEVCHHHATRCQPLGFISCSTPYGITGIVTRHWRISLPITNYYFFVMCSTPYGITGIVTISRTVGSPFSR